VNPNYVLIPAVILVLGWFAFGVIFNLRRGEALLRWIQKGLPRIGERTTLRWLGTSVVELVIAQAKKPFKRLETLAVLAPRDIPWMWLLASFQGRRDTLIFRAHLLSPPHLDLELADPASWTGRLALQKAVQLGWESQTYQGLQLMAPAGTLDRASGALAWLAAPSQRLASHYWRLSLRREAPHLEIHLAFPDRSTDAEQFIGSLQELAHSVSDL
jgi:hypothetical protein